MALIDTRCTSCGRVDEVYRAASDWPKTPACGECGSPTEQIHLPPQAKRWTVDPIVIYRAQDGSIRVPPDISSTSTAMYDKQGLERIELRGAADVRRYEAQFNKEERSRINQRIERQQAQHEAAEAARHSENRRCMEQGFQIPEVVYRDGKPVATGRMQTVRLSERGKAILRETMAMNVRKGGPKTYDPGCHFEVYEQDRSNREEYSDGRGRRSR